jgi:SulP family sulfate permease
MLTRFAQLFRRGPGSLQLTAELSGAVLVAFLAANFSLSYAALLFGGAAPSTLGAGVAMMLVTGALLAIAGAVLIPLPFALLAMDGALMAILAYASAEIVGQMRDAPTASLTATLITGLMLASLVAGSALVGMGFLRAGRIVRFIPYQVIAGILAATGWTLAVGGFAVASGHPASLTPFAMEQTARLAVAVLFVATTMTAVSVIKHPAVLPVMALVAVALHHVVFWDLGWNLEEQRRAGWLLPLPQHLVLTWPWSREHLRLVDWSVLRSHVTTVLTLIPVTAISALLSVTGAEAATEQDTDVDRDLRANGGAVIVSAAFGGVLGTLSLSRTVLLYNLGVRSWRAGVAGSLAACAIPLWRPALLGLVPRPVVGGLLLFIGVGMLQQWAIRSRRRLTRTEWVTVLFVLAVAARFGLVAGVVTGLVTGCVVFTVIYSRASPVRAGYRGNIARSNVERPDFEQAILDLHAESILVLHLQGFIFFGTADRLVVTVREEIAAPSGRLRHLVLDFANTDGIDGSALYSFERLVRIAAKERIKLVLTSLSAEVAARLECLPPMPDSRMRIADTLDEGLEWVEETILFSHAREGEGEGDVSVADLLRAEFSDPDSVSLLLGMLHAEEIAAGAVLLRQGELSDDLLLIESGRASVTVRLDNGRDMRVRSYGAGAMVGEIGFALGLPRTATVKADQPCRILRLTRAAMTRLENERPAAAREFQHLMIRRLGERLIDRDQLISALAMGRSRGR